MPDYSLVPVDYQPDFSDFSLVPVDHDPFSADGMIQQTVTQPENRPRLPATEGDPRGYGGGPDGSHVNGGYVPGGSPYSAGFGGSNASEPSQQVANFVFPDSGPTAPDYVQQATGPEAAQYFANVFNGHGAAGYPTIGNASFGAVAQSNIGIIAAGPNSITSTSEITAYDGNRMMSLNPAITGASITVSIDPATRSITVVQNPGRPA